MIDTYAINLLGVNNFGRIKKRYAHYFIANQLTTEPIHEIAIYISRIYQY